MSQQKVVVITGVTKGIGLALSNWFIRHGHIVIGCGRSKEKIEIMNSPLTLSTGSMYSVVDVSNMDSVQNWAQQSISTFGAPDLIINNAAISNKPRNLWEVPLKEFDEMMDVNLKGVNYVIHFFVPSMVSADKGVIINMSSGWGRSTAAETAPYCCTKWGIEGLSMALAKELPPPLACASLNPGTIDTDMLRNYFGDDAATRGRTLEEWVKSAGPFLLSLNNSCNGKQLTVPKEV